MMSATSTAPDQRKTSLWVVATPIGNLGDMSTRATQTLQAVDLILCEDTRHSRKLCQASAISTPLKSLHEHNEAQLIAELLQRLQQGEQMALISDAGTPLISDPGYRLVKACHEARLTVAAVPGPCAAIAALSVAGLPSDRFSFQGFLPAKSAARKKRLQGLVHEPATMIFYESPQRLQASVRDMLEVFGDLRLACQCRELTKAFETSNLGTLAELEALLAADPDQSRGEQVLLVAGQPAADREPGITPAVIALHAELCQHLPPRLAAGLLSQHLGVSRNALYALRLAAGRT